MKKISLLSTALLISSAFIYAQVKQETNTPQPDGDVDIVNVMIAEQESSGPPSSVHAENTDITRSITTPGQTRTIKLKNTIERKMLGYKKWGTHYPTKFIVTANNKVVFKMEQKEVSAKEEVSVIIVDNKLTMHYDYEFLNGRRAGSKTTEFKVAPEATTLTLSFDWKDKENPQHIILDSATVVSSEDIKLAQA